MSGSSPIQKRTEKNLCGELPPSVTLLEGYSLVIYRNEENDRDIRLAVYDSDGKELTDESCRGCPSASWVSVLRKTDV